MITSEMRVDKLIRRLEEHFEDYNYRKSEETAHRKQSLKKRRKELLLHHFITVGLKSEDGHWITDRSHMEELCRKFYKNLLVSSCEVSIPRF